MSLIDIIGDDCINIIINYKNQIEKYEPIDKIMKDINRCIELKDKNSRIESSHNVRIIDLIDYLESDNIELGIKVKCEVKNKDRIYEILPDSYKTPIDYEFGSQSIYREIIKETFITGIKYRCLIGGKFNSITIYTELKKDEGLWNRLKRRINTYSRQFSNYVIVYLIMKLFN